MSLGCSGCREDYKWANSCETRSALQGRPCKAVRNGFDNRGAQHIMEATEDWVADRSYDTFYMAREDGRACRSTERIGS